MRIETDQGLAIEMEAVDDKCNHPDHDKIPEVLQKILGTDGAAVVIRIYYKGMLISDGTMRGSDAERVIQVIRTLERNNDKDAVEGFLKDA